MVAHYLNIGYIKVKKHKKEVLDITSDFSKTMSYYIQLIVDMDLVILLVKVSEHLIYNLGFFFV